MPRPRASRFAFALAASLLPAVAVPVAAQTDPSPAPVDGANWSVPTALGYGGLGFAGGLAMIWDMESDDFGPPPEAIVLLGATTVAGVVTGALIGRRAERAVERGRPVGGGHRAAVTVGVVAAGATLGFLGAIPLINGEGEGTPLGSDERTAFLLGAAGGALGSLYAWRNSDEFTPRDVAVSPAVSRDGGVGLAVRLVR